MTTHDDAVTTLEAVIALLGSPQSTSLRYVTRTGPADLRKNPVAAEALLENASRKLAFERAFAALTDVIQHARSVQSNIVNRCASITHLPAEVLRLIFIEVFRAEVRPWLPFWPDPLPCLVRITSTCSQWRSVAVGIPVLWSFIILDWRAESVDLWVSRSQPRLGLHVRGPRLTWLREYHKLRLKDQSNDIFELYEDWVTIAIEMSESCSPSDIWLRLPRRSRGPDGPHFPRLESLAVAQPGPGLRGGSRTLFAEETVDSLDDHLWWKSYNDYRYSGIHGANSRSEDPRTPLFPCLRSLTLWTAPFHPSRMLGNVTSLDIRYRFSSLLWTSWMTILRQAVNVETLRLSYCLVSSYKSSSPNSSGSQPFPWTRLRSLTLGPGLEGKFIRNVLCMLDSPGLEELSLTLKEWEDESSKIARDLIRTLEASSKLKVLRLAGPESILSPVLTSVADSRHPTTTSKTEHPPPLIPLLEALYLGFDDSQWQRRDDLPAIWRAVRSLASAPPSTSSYPVTLNTLVVSPQSTKIDPWFSTNLPTFRLEDRSSEGTYWTSSESDEGFNIFEELTSKARGYLARN